MQTAVAVALFLNWAKLETVDYSLSLLVLL